MNAAKRQEIFARLRADNPHPTTELHYRNPFELLIAVLLSAQATDVGVNKATGPLFAIADTPAKMLALGVEGFKQHLHRFVAHVPDGDRSGVAAGALHSMGDIGDEDRRGFDLFGRCGVREVSPAPGRDIGLKKRREYRVGGKADC